MESDENLLAQLTTASNPNIWPRIGINPEMWVWKPVVVFKFRVEEHINILEGRTNLSMLRWRSRKARNLGSKFLHLLDSQVNIGVLTKGRSRSFSINFVTRRCNAITLAAFFHPVYAFVRSELNPADAPSRWKVIPEVRGAFDLHHAA